MAMDGVMLSFAVREMQEKLLSGRIDKVNQPESDMLLLAVRSPGSNHKLLLCASPSYARVHTTQETYQNPIDAPMFCMLMRKFLGGGRITDIRQLNGDRVLYMAVENRDGREVHRGYVCFTPARPAVCAQLSYEGVEPSQLLESNLQQLLRMRELAAENGAQLVLFISPYEGAERDLADLLALHCFCEENDIPLIDYNLLYDQLGFDGNTDFFDMNHFNVYGAEKATRYFGRWVVENLGLEASPHPADAQFKADWDNRTW